MTIPISATDVRLISGVPFTNNYKDTFHFTSQANQTSYFNSLTEIHSMDNCSIIEHDGGGMIRVDAYKDDIRQANYLFFKNKTKVYYAFITNMIYQNDRNTNVYFEIDVLQTYRFEYTIQPSFIERLHPSIEWRPNANQLPERFTKNEGIEYGSSHWTKKVVKIQPYDGINFLVIGATVPFHDGAENKISPILAGLPQGLTYYIHPFYYDGSSPTIKIGSASTTGLTDMITLLENMFTNDNSVNTIVTMYVTEFPGLDIDLTADLMSFDGDQVEKVLFDAGSTLLVKGVERFNTMEIDIPINRPFNDSNCSKPSNYPYSFIELTDLKGNTKQIKYSELEDDTLRIKIRGSLGTMNKISYEVVNYGSTIEVNGKFSDYNNGIICESANLLPILNDYLSAFLQGNANTIKANIKNNAIQTGFSALPSVIKTGLNLTQSKMLSGVKAGYDTAQTLSGGVSNQRSIMAQVQDADNTPPSLASQGGNPNFDFGNSIEGVFLIFKTISDEFYSSIRSYFMRYGYAYNELGSVTLKTRSKYNYWKLSEPNIIGNIPTNYLNQIKDIYENGTTLWHTTTMYSYEGNTPLGG